MAEPQMVIENREELILLLSEASELEYMVMLESRCRRLQPQNRRALKRHPKRARPLIHPSAWKRCSPKFRIQDAASSAS